MTTPTQPRPADTHRTDRTDQPTRFTPSRFCWDALDRGAAQELWDELVDWMSWFRVRYELQTTLPGCWYRHPRLVEEVTALMTAHRAAYDNSHTGEDGSIEYWPDMAAWHVHYFRPFLHALGEMGINSCTPDECAVRLDVETRTYHDIIEWIEHDLALRPEQSDRTSPERPVSMTPAQIRDAVQAGEADPIDPLDPATGYRYRDRVWTLDTRRKVFTPTPDQPPAPH